MKWQLEPIQIHVSVAYLNDVPFIGNSGVWNITRFHREITGYIIISL
jgi:hypothetical protein